MRNIRRETKKEIERENVKQRYKKMEHEAGRGRETGERDNEHNMGVLVRETRKERG